MRISIIFGMAVLIIASIFLIGCGEPTIEEKDTLASCLTQKGAVMYGASWCPHCQAQKEMFGTAFSKVKYVECEEEKQKCADEEITGLPTWKFADGSRLEGKQEFKVLADKAGCKI
jgi:thiol-disulfide isomerase/thioredoxin